MFESNREVKGFIKFLIEKLGEANESVLREELMGWDNCSFTVASEFLGELKLILEKVRKLETLDPKVMEDVISCIKAIDKAFGKMG